MTQPSAVDPFALIAELTADSGQSIEQFHDHLKLLGVVLGQIALLDVATTITTEKTAAAKVAAARVLTSLKESPDAIAERLRRSPFAGLNANQLHRIVDELKAGKTDLQAIITHITQEKTE